MSRNIRAIAVGLGASSALMSASAHAGAVPISALFLEGDGAPGTSANFQSFDRPNITAGGKVFFAGDTDGGTSADDVVYFDGTLIAQEGTVAVGTAGVFSSFEFFETARQVNSSGAGVFISTLTGGAPSGANRAIHTGDSISALSLVALEGDAAPGIASRLFVDFGFAGITEDGRIGFLADLDGATGNDSVIYFDGAPLFREGDPVPASLGLAPGTTWDGDFDEINWNADGDLIFEGNTSLGSGDMAVVVYSASTGMSTIAVQEGQAVAASGGADFLELILQTSLADNGRWAMRGNLGVAPSTSDAVILTDDGRIIQEGAPVPELGAGVVTGNFNAVSMNGNGDVVYLADIAGAADPNIDEGIFWNGKLLVTDGVQVPGLPAGTLFSDLGFEDVYVNDAGQVVFGADYSGTVVGDGLFILTLPPACPGDITGPGGMPDGQIDVDDLNALLAAWNTSVSVGDPRDLANDDGFIDVDDLNVLLANWQGMCP